MRLHVSPHSLKLVQHGESFDPHPDPPPPPIIPHGRGIGDGEGEQRSSPRPRGDRGGALFPPTRLKATPAQRRGIPEEQKEISALLSLRDVLHIQLMQQSARNRGGNNQPQRNQHPRDGNPSRGVIIIGNQLIQVIRRYQIENLVPDD